MEGLAAVDLAAADAAGVVAVVDLGVEAFRNFNPSQPHGSIFYQVSNGALDSAQWSPTLLPQTKPSSYTNKYGVTFAESPYIPGLTKPNPKQFLFFNLTGQKNLNAFLGGPARVPTALEREGNFSESTQVVNGVTMPVTIYDPATGQAVTGDNLANATTPISPQALALLQYYPAPNIPTNAQGYNYETISNAGNNVVAVNTRYMRTLGGKCGIAVCDVWADEARVESAGVAAAEHQHWVQLLALGERFEEYLSAAGGDERERWQCAERGLRGFVWKAVEPCDGDVEPAELEDAELLYEHGE